MSNGLKKTVSRRVQELGASIFAKLHALKLEKLAAGHSIIDLSIGSPDLPPVAELRMELARALEPADAFQYPSSRGTLAFREMAAQWMQARFGVELDPHSEILVLIGTQDGLAHLPLAIGDVGDLALVPDPGYPIHLIGAQIAGMEIYRLTLREENGFLPDLQSIPEDIKQRASLLMLSYPSNPTSAVATREDILKWVDFAQENGVLLAHDLAYSEMAFDGEVPMSVLSIPGAKEVAVEFHSLSKSFHLAGARIGFIAGNAKVIESLHALKANIDYGVFEPVQQTGIAALSADLERIGRGEQAPASLIYAQRRALFVEGLRSIGWEVPMPRATMFVWAPVPDGYRSEQFAEQLLEKAGVVVVPGNAFGEAGEGYVRIAMVQSESMLRDAIERIRDFWNNEIVTLEEKK